MNRAKSNLSDRSSPRRSTAAVFLAAAGVLLVSMALIYWLGLAALNSNRQLGDYRTVIGEMQQLTSTLKDAETGQRGYLLTGDKRYLAPYNQAATRIQTELDQLHTLAAEGKLPLNAWREVSRLVNEKMAELDQTIKFKAEGQSDTALKIVQSRLGKELMDSIRSKMAELESQQVAQFETANRRAAEATHERNWGFLALTLLNLAFLAWAYSEIAREIHKREHAQGETQETAARLRTIVENLSEGVVASDMEGTLLHWNHAALSMHGFASLDEARKRLGEFSSIFELSEPSGAVIPIEKWPLARILRGEELQGWDVQIRRLKGDWKRIFSYGGSLVCDAQGKPTLAVVTISDVTDRKRFEEELRESEQRFRTMADAMPQLAWTANADGWIHWYNRRWYEYTGTTPKQMEGWGWQSVHDPKTLPAVMERWTGSIRSGEPFEMTFPLRGADGVFRPFLTRVLPFRNEDGQIVQWFGTNTDVSEQKRTEELLEIRVQQRTAELATANKELEAFGYSVSHDLRAPLRHVSGYIKLLEKSAWPKLDELSRRQVKTIAEAAERMGHLIDDLLILSRIGRATLTETTVSLQQLVDDARQQLAPEMAGRVIEWNVAKLPQVCGDVSLLRSAIVNLLSNAIKYTRTRNPAIIEVGVENLDHEVVCFVRDNGAGFDMQFVDKLFGVFQRLHDRDEFEGTGIGLASVRRIIQRHGGRTWAEGAVDRGATFYFSVPKERLI